MGGKALFTLVTVIKDYKSTGQAGVSIRRLSVVIMYGECVWCYDVATSVAWTLMKILFTAYATSECNYFYLLMESDNRFIGY